MNQHADDRPNKKLDFSGGSFDWVLEAAEDMCRSGRPYLLIAVGGPDDVDVNARTTPDGAKIFSSLLDDQSFIEHLKFVAHDASKPDSGD